MKIHMHIASAKQTDHGTSNLVKKIWKKCHFLYSTVFTVMNWLYDTTETDGEKGF